jgi:hypothetical protein
MISKTKKSRRVDDPATTGAIAPPKFTLNYGLIWLMIGYSHLCQEQTSVWIRHHGGLTPRLIVLRGRELAAMYPRCR